jgi:hypothetical protein
MTLHLPWPPKELSPNARVHWAKKSKAAKAYRLQCGLMTKASNVKQRGKMARESGKTALKTVHPDMCHDPVFCRRNLGCYLWILLPKSEDVIL